MAPVWILIAFVLGFGATRLGLPPLVGYLVAGFALKAMGAESSAAIDYFSDMGVLLLLFSIGLKLKFKTLARPVIWAGATLHMGVTVVVFSLLLAPAILGPVPVFAVLDPSTLLLVAFALSFSSTVFAVKILEERGEMAALHSDVAIGTLIMQDIFAVLFLTVSIGQLPSLWALAVIPALFVLRPLLGAILDRVGHRELLILFGIFLVIGLGAGGFELVGLKPDLGALILGALLSTHPKADELNKVLANFKDIFLIGFFLSIGLSGLPSPSSIAVAAALLLLLIPKFVLYFLAMTRFQLRSRTALLASLSLFNYSEFGLIVAVVGTKNGWLDPQWPIIIALALSFSFILASLVNKYPHGLYARLSDLLKRFESDERLPEEAPVSTGDAEVVIFGMGRVGTGAYEAMRRHFGDRLMGIDHDADTVSLHRRQGRSVICNDATDPELWERVQLSGRVKLVMLAMPDHQANLYAMRRIMAGEPDFVIAASARYEDEMEELEAAGARLVFNFYAEAGAGFAAEVLKNIDFR